MKYIDTVEGEVERVCNHKEILIDFDKPVFPISWYIYIFILGILVGTGISDQ